MFISNPPALIWRKFLALLSGEVARFLHPTWGGNASCLELIGLVGREGAESRRKYEKTNYIEKYQICHLLIHNLPGAWLRAERNYYLLMVMAWWFEGAIVLSRRRFNRINEIINKCGEEGCSPSLSSPTTSDTETTTFSLPNSFMSKTAAMGKLVHHPHAGILAENLRVEFLMQNSRSKLCCLIPPTPQAFSSYSIVGSSLVSIVPVTA